MEAAGLWMLLAVAAVLLGTGLPAFAVLMGVSVLFGAVGLATGGLEWALLTALPSRIIGLLENDLLQALPLYVFMGALLNRLPLADRLFRCGVPLGGRSTASPALATLGLGAMLAPMNGSVGASVAMLSRSVAPKLAQRGVPAAESTALVCVASTLGVVIPPSLVLISSTPRTSSAVRWCRRRSSLCSALSWRGCSAVARSRVVRGSGRRRANG